MTSAAPDERLIVALDTPGPDSALTLVARLGDLVNFYKIGLGMLSAGGLELAAELKRGHGKRVFLDLKLFDISAVVSAAVSSISELNPDFLTVHGDPHVIRAAVEARRSAATRILAVTVLTSLDRSDLDEAMLADGSVNDIAVERARRAFVFGADGVISSPLEARQIRGLDSARGKLIVTPGTRPRGALRLGQKRISTPSEAIGNGADHLVVGRPVTQSPDPVKTVRDILKELPRRAEPP